MGNTAEEVLKHTVLNINSARQVPDSVCKSVRRKCDGHVPWGEGLPHNDVFRQTIEFTYEKRRGFYTEHFELLAQHFAREKVLQMMDV